MSKLCPELWHAIATQLRDVRSFRLVCKGFATIGGEYLVPRLHVTQSEHSFMRLLRIARDLVVCRSVRQITYDCTLLSRHLVRFEDWISQIQQEADFSGFPYKHDIEQAHITYIQKLRDQHKFSYTPQLFLLAMQRFPKLASISFSGNGFASELGFPSSAEHICGQQALSAFSKALEHLSKIRTTHRLALTKLQLNLQWSCIEKSLLGTSSQIWRCITDIDICLEVLEPTPPFQNCLVLKRFTQELTNLQRLSLEYSNDWDLEEYLPIQEILSTTFRWPNLRILKFSGLEFSVCEFSSLLECNSGIKFFTISDCRLATGTLEVLLHRIGGWLQRASFAETAEVIDELEFIKS
jgi:hypothetical protein